MGEVVRVYSAPEVENNIVPFPVKRVPHDAFKAAREELAAQKSVKAFDGIDEINQMVAYYLERNRFRDVCLLVLGLNTSFRIGDLLEFRWRELVNNDWSFVENNAKKENKRGHIRHIYVNFAIGEATLLYLKTLKRPFDIDEYMFVSEGHRAPLVEKLDDDTGEPLLDSNGKVILERKPLTTQQARNIIRLPAKELGLYTPDRKISTHSMRKTAADTIDDLLEGREMPDGLARKNSNAERSRAFLGHMKVSTTSQHYLSTESKVNKKLTMWMNLGLEAILDFKEAHPEYL